MSGVVDLSYINEFYKQNIRCVRATSLDDLNILLRHKSVVSVYHHDIANMVVYYIDDTCVTQ